MENRYSYYSDWNIDNKIEFDKNGNPIVGQKLICPICKKEFKSHSDTRYLVKGGFTCSWKCFLNSISQQKTYQD